MRILFIGCVESSYRLLKKLIEEKVSVAGVITKEASGFHADFCDLRPLCVEHGIPCFYAHNVNDLDSMEFIRSLAPDAGFCFGFKTGAAGFVSAGSSRISSGGPAAQPWQASGYMGAGAWAGRNGVSLFYDKCRGG